MTHTYHISGITCNNCVSRITSELLKIGDITEANIQMAAPQATITMQRHINTRDLQAALKKAGHYTIAEADAGMQMPAAEEPVSWFATYKPILIICFYILLVTAIGSFTANGFRPVQAMMVFMSGFFLTFSFFKMLDLKGFADSYASYDIIAKKIRIWGFIYPFMELLLGIAYAIGIFPLITNIVTLLLMGVSIVGVLQSVLNKRKIRCACLGSFFNLPMSTVTIIEDAAMIAMSGIMLSLL